MSNYPWLTLVKKHRAIAVIRAPKLELGLQMALAIAAGGINLIEITWNSANAPQLITKLRSELPGCMIGTGTLLNLTHINEAVSAGAQFLFTPHVDPAMIQAATEQNTPIIPGALSPTEIVTAWNHGASSVKVYPVQAVGGAEYIKSLQEPLGHIPLIPTGGVTLENTREFLQAGAVAVGLSSQLFPKQFVESGNWEAISQQARILMESCSLGV